MTTIEKPFPETSLALSDIERAMLTQATQQLRGDWERYIKDVVPGTCQNDGWEMAQSAITLVSLLHDLGLTTHTAFATGELARQRLRETGVPWAQHYAETAPDSVFAPEDPRVDFTDTPGEY